MSAQVGSFNLGRLHCYFRSIQFMISFLFFYLNLSSAHIKKKHSQRQDMNINLFCLYYCLLENPGRF